jgi:hypothetical protein
MNLVLALAGRGDDGNVLRLLEEITTRFYEFTGEEAGVVVIALEDGTPNAKSGDWPFVILVDGENRGHRFFNARDSHGTASPAVFVADRYGEIYVGYRSKEGQGLPAAD